MEEGEVIIQLMERRSYKFFSRLLAACVAIAILLICCEPAPKQTVPTTTTKRPTDLFAIFNAGPLDRAQSAVAINKISQCNPKVIGISIMFEGRKTGAGDLALANAVASAGNVVFAMDYHDKYEDEPHSSDSIFLKGSKGEGVIYLTVADRKVDSHQLFVNTHETILWSFPLSVAGHFNPDVATNTMHNAQVDTDYKIFFEWDNEDFYYINLEELDCSKISDKIVLIGITGPDNEDLYPTSDGKKRYGAIIFANIIQNIMDGKFEEAQLSVDDDRVVAML